MRKKLREEAGLTMVEMLAATVILMLLALMLNTGLQMMFHTYQTMIAKSEVELLLSTAVDALADDLRYAWNVTPETPSIGGDPDAGGDDVAGLAFAVALADDDEDDGGGDADDGEVIPPANVYVDFKYSSDSYGDETRLDVADEGDYAGQLIANSTNKDKITGDSISKTWPVLPTGAYGSGAVMSYKKYRVTDLEITHDDSSGVVIFTINLRVATIDGKISAETTVTVRCLNPPKATESPEVTTP